MADQNQKRLVNYNEILPHRLKLKTYRHTCKNSSFLPKCMSCLSAKYKKHISEIKLRKNGKDLAGYHHYAQCIVCIDG